MKKLLLSLISAFFIMGAMAQYDVTFQVDMTGATFDPATQGVFMSGDFLGWTEPGANLDYQLALVSDNIYNITFQFDGDTSVSYKYFIVDNGTTSWANGEWNGDPNRVAVFNGEKTIENLWALKPMTTTFNVDLSNVEPFGTDTTEVFMAGDFGGWAQPGTVKYWKMNPSGENPLIYTFTTVFYPGDYQFKFFFVYNQVPSWDFGEWTGDPNRTFTIVNDTTMDYVWGEIAGIDNNFTNSSMNIYPNPCQNNLNVVINNNEVTKIEVLSITGAVIREIENIDSEMISIDTRDMRSGMYFVAVYSENKVTTSKFIKN